MAETRTDIAIATAEAIRELLEKEVTELVVADAREDTPEKVAQVRIGFAAGLGRARQVIETFIAASRVGQSPRVGRPRKSKAEA